MSFLVPVTLLGFVPVAILLFVLLPGRRALIATYVGGWLFLPQAGYALAGLPDYDKTAAIALGALLGTFIFEIHAVGQLRPKWFDAPITIFCVWPFISHVVSGNELTTGLNWCIAHLTLWGIPYLLGRIHFRTQEDLRELAVGVFIGGLVYAPLCWLEIRFSPQLHTRVYGFFQHNFLQHIRYGGFRPIVFMQHGIMVGTWMASATFVGFWLWRTRLLSDIGGIPMRFIVPVMLLTTIFCKVGSALGVLCFAILTFAAYQTGLRRAALVILGLVPLVYIGARASSIWSGDMLLEQIGSVDEERAGSLAIRMHQEDLYTARAAESPVFGFPSGDFVPVDEEGDPLARGNDGFWIITLGLYGGISLIAVFTVLALPVWLMAFNTKHSTASFMEIPATVLAVVVCMFAIDCLVNAMINPIYLLCAGAVTSFATQPASVAVERARAKCRDVQLFAVIRHHSRSSCQ